MVFSRVEYDQVQPSGGVKCSSHAARTYLGPRYALPTALRVWNTYGTRPLLPTLPPTIPLPWADTPVPLPAPLPRPPYPYNPTYPSRAESRLTRYYQLIRDSLPRYLKLNHRLVRHTSASARVWPDTCDSSDTPRPRACPATLRLVRNASARRVRLVRRLEACQTKIRTPVLAIGARTSGAKRAASFCQHFPLELSASTCGSLGP